MHLNFTIRVGAAFVFAFFGMMGSLRADTVTTSASADTYITEYSSLGGPDSNHGASAALWSEGVSPNYTYPLVRFDLSGYAGDTVEGSASVRLYLNDAGNDKDAITQAIDVSQSLDAWDENTVTWNNYGGSGPVLDTQIVNWGLDQFSYVSWTIPASVVQSWIDNSTTNNGLIFVGSTPTGSSDLLFSSREGADAPQLVFTEVSAAPLPPSGLSGLALLSGLAIVTCARRWLVGRGKAGRLWALGI